MTKRNPYYFAVVLAILASIIATTIPYYLQKFIDSDNQLSFTNPYIVGIVIIFVLQLVLQIVANGMIAIEAAQKVTDLRSQLVDKVLKGKMSDVTVLNSGAIASHIVNDVSEVREYWTTYLPNFISGCCVVIGSIGFLIALDWQLTVILFLTLPILALLIAPMSGMNHRMMSQYQAQQATYMAHIVESVRELMPIKANQEEKKISQNLNDQAKVIGHAGFRLDVMSGITTPLMMFVLFSVVIVIFTYGGLRVSQGTLSTGTLVAFLVYLFQLLSPISALSNFFNEKAKVKGTYESLQAIMEIQEEQDTGTDEPVAGVLAFDGVSFAYGETMVLENVTFTVQPQTKVAFVGPSGSGKTTLMNLLLRMYEPTRGTITIDGQPVDQVSLSGYRQLFSYVTQSGGVVSGTFLDNLGVGEEHYDDIVNALQAAQLWEDIKTMPAGLHTIVGEGGSLLSGGQKQRLMIAKAILKDTPYLIFDEATSNLDVETEAHLQTALTSLRGHKTLIYIAHRLNTILDADCIYFIENGYITGSGKHEELLLKHPTYAQYIQSSQLS